MKSKFLQALICIFVFMVFPITIFAQFPPDTQLVVRKMPTGIAKPAYSKSIIDPTYGTTITCITDETVFGPTAGGTTDWYAPYRRHRWFKIQPWNADGTKIIIDLTNPPYLVDGKSYAFIKRYTPNSDANNPPSEATWSNIDPNIMYGVGANTNTLYKYSLTNGKRILKQTFSDYNAISFGLGEGNLSNDDKYIALHCSKGSVNKAVVYDMQADTIVSTLDMGVNGAVDYTNGINWVTMSQTGKYVVFAWERGGTGRFMGIELFDNKLNFIRQITSVIASGNINGVIVELGLDADGNDVVVYQNQTTFDIMTDRLKDAAVTKVLSGTKVSKSTTISCRNIKRPGWAYLSDFEAGQEALDLTWSLGRSDSTKASYNTAFALKLDGSEKVEIFGHEHHSKNGGLYVQPMAVPDPTGKRVMFASVWDNEDVSTTFVGGPFKTARIVDYVAEYITANAINKTNIKSQLINKSYNVITSLPLHDNREIFITSQKVDDYNVSIRDIFGKKVYEKQFSNTKEASVKLTGLNSNAIYFLKVVNKTNQVVTKKLL